MTEDSNNLEAAKRKMLNDALKGRKICDQRVLAAMQDVPREEFVPEKYREYCYADEPLPIGFGQTISQPYIVALMSQTLQVEDDSEILEIGTGCGYQTAILARLGEKVYTIERYNNLTEIAQAHLAKLGIDNVEFYIGDGTKGWPSEDKKFDRIILTAAIPSIPDTLLDQLQYNGVIVAPVGAWQSQMLIKITKKPDKLKQESICPVRFVRMIGEYGFSE